MAKIKKIKLPNESAARDLTDAGATRFDEAQSLNATQKTRARTNINAQEALAFEGTYNATSNKVTTKEYVNSYAKVITQNNQLVLDLTDGTANALGGFGNLLTLNRNTDIENNEFSSTGLYLIQYDGTSQHYEKIPDIPQETGDYVLKCSVNAAGQYTMSWQKED